MLVVMISGDSCRLVCCCFAVGLGMLAMLVVGDGNFLALPWYLMFRVGVAVGVAVAIVVLIVSGVRSNDPSPGLAPSTLPLHFCFGVSDAPADAILGLTKPTTITFFFPFPPFANGFPRPACVGVSASISPSNEPTTETGIGRQGDESTIPPPPRPEVNTPLNFSTSFHNSIRLLNEEMPSYPIHPHISLPSSKNQKQRGGKAHNPFQVIKPQPLEQIPPRNPTAHHPLSQVHHLIWRKSNQRTHPL